MNRQGSHTVALVFAAGQSKRMGAQNKLLKEFNDITLIRSVANAALDSQCASVVIVLGHQSEEIIRELAGLDVVFVDNPNFRDGMASSIKVGVRALEDFDCANAVMLLADMPNVTSRMIDQLMEASENAPDGAIVIATSSGRRGNPVVWPKRYFSELKTLSGDQGARQIFDKFHTKILEVEIGPAARLDFDTPQAFESAAQTFSK